MQLRPFQLRDKTAVLDAWRGGAKNILLVEPTGAGKTVIFSDIIREQTAPVCAIAHRGELLSQMSLALARNHVRHRIIGSADTLRNCVILHKMEIGTNYIDQKSHVSVASVDTLVKAKSEPWMDNVRLWVCDEAHHLLTKNKWGRAISFFPNANGLGVTATPTRADGYGLGAHADGVFNHMIVGPTGRELIRLGYLSDYRIFCPPSDIDLSNVPISAGGDYSPPALAKAVHGSHVVGDVVRHYQAIAPGKRGITFAVDIESAIEISKAFRAAGVPSEVVTSDTHVTARAGILRKFRNGEILQLVNVDLFGEGFDVPACHVVSMARPTRSFALYSQQFGRALRLDANDPLKIAIIIDHVHNVVMHGLPDRPRDWSLDRRERRTSVTPKDAIPLTVCPACTRPYEKIYNKCPYCGNVVIATQRSRPEFVDGDLHELTPEALSAMRGETDTLPTYPYDASAVIINSVNARHRERNDAQMALRYNIALWAGYRKQAGDADSAIYRRFYHAFGIDVMGAQTLGKNDANALCEKIQLSIGFA